MAEQVFRNLRAQDIGTNGTRPTTTTQGSGGVVSRIFYYDPATTPTAEITVEKINEFQDYNIYVEGRYRDGEPWVATTFTDFNDVSGSGSGGVARLIKQNESTHLGLTYQVQVTFDTMPQIRVRVLRAQDAGTATQYNRAVRDIQFYPKTRLDGTPYRYIENAEAGQADISGSTVQGWPSTGILGSINVPFDNDAGGINGTLGTGAGQLRTRPKLQIIYPKGTPPTDGWPLMMTIQHSDFDASDPIGTPFGDGGVATSSAQQITEYLDRGMAVAVLSCIGHTSPLKLLPDAQEAPYWLKPLDFAARTLLTTGEDAAKAQRDVLFAIQHLKAYAADYGIDTSYFFIGGRSGGGALAYWAAAAPDISIPNSDDPQRRENTKVDGVVAAIAPMHFAGFDPSQQDLRHLQKSDLSDNVATGLLDSDINSIIACSPASFMFREDINPGCRARVGSTPYYLLGALAADGGDPSAPAGGANFPTGLYFNIPIGTTLFGASDLGTITGATSYEQGTGSPGVTLCLDDAHLVWEQLQMMYMLRSLSREDNQFVKSGPGTGQLFHDYYSEFSYSNRTTNSAYDNSGVESEIDAGTTASGWLNKFQAKMVSHEADTLEDQYRNSIPWLQKVKPEIPLEDPVALEASFNIYIGGGDLGTGAVDPATGTAVS